MVLGALLFAFILANASPQTQTLRAQDYGAVGDGKTDDGGAVLKMLDAAAQLHTPVRLQFAPNKAYFLKSGRQRYAFLIDGAINLTIDGGGSLFLVDSQQRFLKLTHSQNVTVENLNVDYVPLPFADGTVVAKDKAAGTIDVRIDDGEVLPPLGGATHEDGEQAYFGALWHHGAYEDRSDGGPYWVRDNFDVRDVRAGSAPRVVQIQSEPNSGVFDAIGPGTWRFSVPVRGIAHRYGPGESFWLGDNRDLTLNNIELWSAPWFAFGINGSRGQVVLRHVSVWPKPGTRRNASAWRDAFHVKNNRASLLFEDCTVQGNSDDAFNIASHTTMVREIVSPTRIKISQNFPLGIAAMEPGDTLVFYSPRRGALVGRARIVTAGPPNNAQERAPLFTLDLAASVVGLEAGSTLVWNVQSSNPDTTLRRCRMDTSCRFRSPVTIDGCRINALAWFTGDEIEGPVPSNVTVRNSVFRLGQGNPNIVMAMGGPSLGGHGPTEPVIENVMFDHNRIWGDFVLSDSNNVTLIGNAFEAADRRIVLSDVQGVTLRGNTRAGKAMGRIAEQEKPTK